jgi:hypothetical protein
MAVIAVALVAIDGSGTGGPIRGSTGLTIAFLVVVAAVAIALAIFYARRRRWRREVERLNSKR